MTSGWTVPPFCKGRSGGISLWLERSPPAHHPFAARLLGHRNVRLLIRALRDICSVERRIELVRFLNVERRPVQPLALAPEHKNPRCTCRWVFADRTQRRGFVFVASGATVGVRRRSDGCPKSELWFLVGDCRVTSENPPDPPFFKGGAAFLEQDNYQISPTRVHDEPVS